MDSDFLLLAKKIAKDKLSPLLAADSSTTAYRTLILDIREKYMILKNNIGYDDIIRFTSGGIYTLDLGRYVAKSRRISGDGKNIFFPLSEIAITGSDLSLQNSEKTQYECTFINPFDAMTAIRKPVVALSDKSFCLKNRIDSALFQDGLVIKDLKIETKEKIIKVGDGTVRRKQPVFSLRGILRQEILVEWMG